MRRQILPGYYSFIEFKTDLTVIDTATPSYTSFNGHKRIASGSLTVSALAVKHAQASDVASPLLIFCDQTGQVVDIDIRGSDAEMLARLAWQLRGHVVERNGLRLCQNKQTRPRKRNETPDPCSNSGYARFRSAR